MNNEKVALGEVGEVPVDETAAYRSLEESRASVARKNPVVFSRTAVSADQARQAGDGVLAAHSIRRPRRYAHRADRNATSRRRHCGSSSSRCVASRRAAWRRDAVTRRQFGGTALLISKIIKNVIKVNLIELKSQFFLSGSIL